MEVLKISWFMDTYLNSELKSCCKLIRIFEGTFSTKGKYLLISFLAYMRQRSSLSK